MPLRGLEYGAVRQGRRWGTASCIRAVLAFAITAYLYLQVYATRPQDTVSLTFWCPIALMICVFGLWYGVRGLQRDSVRQLAIVGIVANALLAGPSIAGTVDAVREIRTAYRYTGGVIIMADR